MERDVTIEVELLDDSSDRKASQQLEQELRKLSLVSLERPPRPVPDGAKAGAAPDAAALLVTLGSVVVPALVQVIVHWLSRRRDKATDVVITKGDKVFKLSHSKPISEELISEMVRALQ